MMTISQRPSILYSSDILHLPSTYYDKKLLSDTQPSPKFRTIPSNLSTLSFNSFHFTRSYVRYSLTPHIFGAPATAFSGCMLEKLGTRKTIVQMINENHQQQFPNSNYPPSVTHQSHDTITGYNSHFILNELSIRANNTH